MRAAVGSERWPPEQIHPALHEDHADAGDHGSSAPDQSTADPWKNNEEQVRREPRTDRAQCRSCAPDDHRGPRRQDETRRTVDPGHSSDGPSWIDLAENRVTTTESRFAARLNRLLQQNRPIAEVAPKSEPKPRQSEIGASDHREDGNYPHPSRPNVSRETFGEQRSNEGDDQCPERGRRGPPVPVHRWS